MGQLQFWLSKLRLSELQVWLSHSLGQARSSELRRLFSRHDNPTSPTAPSGQKPCAISKSVESRTARCLPALALVLPTLLSLYLAVTHRKLYGSSLVKFVLEHRTSVQILVQVLAHLLSIAEVSCLCTLFNFVTRLKLERVTLRKLSLWSALSNVKIDWNLPLTYLLLTIFIAFLSIVPGALWAGALTPVVTLGRIFTTNVEVASYSPTSTDVWNSEFQLDEHKNVWNRILNCTTVHNSLGLIPSCPVPGLQALLLLSASTATVAEGSQRIHAKLDNRQWTYTGRSYGVGSSMGLTFPSFDLSVMSNLIANVHYLESGYDAQVNCIRNSSSDVKIEYWGDFGPNSVSYYDLQGRLPNEPPNLQAEFYPIPVFNWSSPKIAAWAARSWEGRNVLAIATGGDPSTAILDKIQCEVEFIPTQFQVAVNLTSYTIAATPVSSRTEDFEPSGNLKSYVVESLNLFSRLSPSLYHSLIGNALLTNVQNLQTQLNVTKHDDDIVTRAAADSFTAMIDDILVAYGASQLVIAHDSILVEAFGDAYGVQLGDLAYIYAAMFLNAVIVAAYLVESIRTCFWAGVSKFNYVDLPTMVLAASGGGTDVADAFRQWQALNGLDEWDGDGRNRSFDAIKISVCRHCIVPAMDDHRDGTAQSSRV